MIEHFRSDFFWMQRECKGLYPWAAKHPYRLVELLCECRDHPFCRGGRGESPHNLINSVLEGDVLSNALLDLYLKAMIRAEIRFVSRFIPQRSNEERLTGNLVSEIDAALYLVREPFSQLAMERYREPKDIDFYYYDLSKGGRIESDTGADLGFIFVIDLPDYPYTVRSIRLQAKKLQGTAQIDLGQFDTLGADKNDTAYLFYDMDQRTLSSPLVVESERMANHAEKARTEGKASFTVGFDEAINGIPLSLYTPFQLMSGRYGRSHHSFDSAYAHFRNQTPGPPQSGHPSGRLGIVSLGRPISIRPNNDGDVDITIQGSPE